MLQKPKHQLNGLQFARLMAEFAELGFDKLPAIARMISETTGVGYFTVYRALLNLDQADNYLKMMEQTIEKIRHE